MLKFFTSISFLYIFVIAILAWYGLVYYKQVTKNGHQKKLFPWIFLLVTAACCSFLYLNFHPGKKLNSFSNLDHHFIRHDGFRVSDRIELGGSDTALYPDKPFSQFHFEKRGNELLLQSPYSEEPFYISSGGTVKLASVNFPAEGHNIFFRCEQTGFKLSAAANNSFELSIDNRITARASRVIGKGLSAWSLFRDDTTFLASGWYANEKIQQSLKSILLLKDDFSANTNGHLSFFLSGKIFANTDLVKFDDVTVDNKKLSFSSSIPENSITGWGVGFPSKNRNQFRIMFNGDNSYSLVSRYPVSYPLTEEVAGEGPKAETPYAVSKFLISGAEQLTDVPGVFNEGFLFASFPGDSTTGFSPVLLNYYKDRADAPLLLKAKMLNNSKREIAFTGNKFLLQSNSPGLSWEFSIQDTFQWNFAGWSLSQSSWEKYIFGSLLFFFALIFFASFLKPADKLSWVWQLLSCIIMVMLTTRFFLYWRYKSFPPYEGLDLPSLQQLNSFWNFGIIILATLLLGVLFGFSVFKYLYKQSGRMVSRLLDRAPAGRNISKSSISAIAENISDGTFLDRLRSAKLFFFASWILILAAGGAFAAIKNFDPATCRHLAIILVLIYFAYVYLSCRFSPLIAAREKSWWSISTGSTPGIIISNPVKLLLSLSMLALFLFIDIGFGLIFFNFLLFNEAFLCINFSIAGLSAGSRRNASIFGAAGVIYILLFAVNLLYGPYIFRFMLDLPQSLYIAACFLFAVLITYSIGRLLPRATKRKLLFRLAAAVSLFILAVLFFPKERIQKKAAVTKYRIDVLTMPPDKVVEKAFEDGDSYEPVIRAAQNQWFINTFIHEENNPAVNNVAFHLMPHAPQNRGAKYNAQATDLVASRFLIAEHGRWSVILFVLLLLLPAVLLASFYKLYPDFTNRINNNFATVITGFSVLNYLLITALLVVLAATGRYIFFGQDLPFGSILSKQSILFPSVLLALVMFLFSRTPVQQYPNKGKLFPGMVVFAGLSILLFFVKPAFNKSKNFEVAGLAKNMDTYIRSQIQPLFDEIDTAASTRRLSAADKDRIFSNRLSGMIRAGQLNSAGPLLVNELSRYCRSGFSGHLNQNSLLFLDLHSGSPQLAVNENYFHVEPPPHLQQKWAGSIYGDSTSYNVMIWDAVHGSAVSRKTGNYTDERSFMMPGGFEFTFRKQTGENMYDELCLINRSDTVVELQSQSGSKVLARGDTLLLRNPDRIYISGTSGKKDKMLVIQPDAFMKNYYLNGNRFYYYPMGSDFIWARNFAENISSEYTGREKYGKNVFISPDVALTDSLSQKIRRMMMTDTAYKNGAEYAICVADGNGRLLAMPDHIKRYKRPDPNDKAAFNLAIRGENGFIPQSELRKKTGNINLMRMRPGPGSTLKPIIFSAVASQMPLDWDAFAAEGFSEKQEFFGGEKVSGYDFEKNNGRITNVADYIRYSDNYYHANLLLLGSYSKQSLQNLLAKHFTRQNPGTGLHWPYFSYNGGQYWLNGFENWPGYVAGKANFGSDSSFVSAGLFSNYGIHTHRNGKNIDRFISAYDSALFGNAYNKSGFVFPEYSLFDQKGEGMNMDSPNEVFMSSFRGHVKGSSQVMIPPVKMLDVFGKLISQSRNYSVTLNPYAQENLFCPFALDNTISQSGYLSLMKNSVFRGMKEALYSGTAARLGGMLKNSSPYFYYAKTGTTGDDELKTKSKLFSIIISQKDIASPDFNFRKNKFIIIYFTSQNGPAKQNEEFQAEVIRLVEQSPVFKKYMQHPVQ